MHFTKQTGWIEVICGCMFSGKSEELIRRIKRARIARMRTQVFKPAIDDRYHTMAVVSHDGVMEEAMAVRDSAELWEAVHPLTEVVAIDEVQFFDEGILGVCQRLSDRGVRVICAGLDLDFRGEPFGVTPALLAVAEYITKLHAICLQCGNPATRTQRLIDGRPARYGDPVILVGASERYEARCRQCHVVPDRPVAVASGTHQG